MTTQVLQEFLVKIGIGVNRAKLAEANAGIASAGRSAALLDKEATAAAISVESKLIPSLKTMLLPVTAVTAALGLAYRSMFKFVETSADGLERVSHLANRVNTTSEAIKKLGFVAQFSRSSVQAAEMSLDGLNRAAGETALGVGRAKKIFEEIGLSVKDSNGHLKDTSLLMTQLGEKIKGMERGKQLAILEKMGIDKTMIEVLTTDVGGLGDEFDDLYKSVGININQSAESAVKFKDAIGKVGVAMKLIKDSIAIAFFDEFKGGFHSFYLLLKDNLPKIISAIKPVLSDLLKIGAIVIKLGVTFIVVAAKIVRTISKINDATNGWALKVGEVILAIKILNSLMRASPVGRIIALAAAFLALYDDYKTWEKGGESFIDWGSKTGTIVKVAAAAVAALATGFGTLSLATFSLNKAMAALDIVAQLNPVVVVITAVAGGIALLTDNINKLLKAFSGAKDDMGGFLQAASKLENIPGIGLGGQLAGLLPSFGDKKGAAGNITMNQKTEITVHGAGSPQETASAIKKQQASVSNDQIRNLQGALR